MMRWKNGTNFQLKFLVMGLWLVLMALGLRLLGFTTAGTMLARLDAGQVLAIAGECLSAQSVTAATASEKVELPEKPPDDPPAAVQEEPEPAFVPVTFTGQEAEAIAIGGSAESTVDKTSLLLSPLNMRADTAPQVLIVHTHTTESYTPSPSYNYTPTETDRTLDSRFNMVAVGEVIYEKLTQKGINVIHDKTVHDYPSYNASYQSAEATIRKNLNANSGIKVVLDVHRDGITREDGTKVKVAGEINGEKVAQCMFVIGSNALLTHDNWQENLKLACKIQKKANEMYPGLMRPIILREERFNQQISKGCVIIEVGSNGNTLEEAVLGGKYIAEVIVKVLKNW